MGKGNVSIYTIAKEAGVSPATVSRVINGSARVSEEKKKRVQELIEIHNFQPNALARSLMNMENRLIGLLVSDIRNPFYSMLAMECEAAAYRRGYLLMVCNSLGDNSRDLDYLNKFYRQRVDAVIQIGGSVDAAVPDPGFLSAVNRMAESIPFLTTGPLEGADCYRINIDEEQSMRLLMEYLHENGHEKIALVGGRRDVKSTAEKQRVYREMLTAYGIPVRREYILENGAYDVEGGEKTMMEFLESGCALPTAVIAINDFTAVGVTHALREKGIRIPEEVSVVSFDNTFITETCVPRLTSVGYDYHAMGERLIETVIGAIHSRLMDAPGMDGQAAHDPEAPEKKPPRLQMIRPELAVRNSAGKNRYVY